MSGPLPLGRSSTNITDLDTDTLGRCADFLRIRDVTNMAMSCKHLKTAAYSDSIWQSLFRQEWPHIVPYNLVQASSMRDAYTFRHNSLRQFKYADPLVSDIHIAGELPYHILFDKKDIIFSQGSHIRVLHTGNVFNENELLATLGNHKAKITCMRLFPVGETSLYRNESEKEDNILITSSRDHFIRLWWKGGTRCFKGHNAPVSCLSDKLLGHENGKIFASGGEDGTVRIWSINSSGKRGQQALKATLYGHEKTVSMMAVAGHKASLLVSLSQNGKVRVWDTTTASSSMRSTCCVGMASVHGAAPVGMKCRESLLYVAAGLSITAIDLRTMNQVATMAQEEKIESFEVSPSKSVLCTGGSSGSAILWDLRRVSDSLKIEPITELDGHVGPVKLLHMDSYKVVTGGPDDPNVNIWEPDTGKMVNSLVCSDLDGPLSGAGCVGMAIDRCRIVTASGYDGLGILRLLDFNGATRHVSSNGSEESSAVSKFWDLQSDSDSED